jgi:hypothetical protein
MKHAEFAFQKLLCRYISVQYPNVLFISTGTSLKLTAPQQARNGAIQKNGFAVPDLLILQPNKYYFGLCLELKIETPFKRDGTIKASKNDHLKNQLETIEKLNALEYYAAFVWDFETAKKIIDDYLKNV